MSAKDAGKLASNADSVGYTFRKSEQMPGAEGYHDIELKVPYSKSTSTESCTWVVLERVNKIFALLQVPEES